MTVTTEPLPVWPPASDTAFFAAAKEVFEQFRGYGLPVAGSLGLVAQAEAESAFKIEIIGDDGTAHGLFQLHADRIAQIKAAIGVDISTAPPIDEQCAAAFWELQTFPYLGLAQLQAAKTANEAGIIACELYERAGAANAAARRGQMAVPLVGLCRQEWVGMMTPTFIQHPTHYTLAEFRAMLAGLKLGAWRPKFPTLHNTAVPSLAQWLAYGPTPQERWGANLNRYYEGLGWHAGPHAVVCPDYIWVLCDLTKPGVSVSCWNSETIGLEMIGNYEVGGDDFSEGEGAKVRDNAAAVLALLCQTFKWPDLGDYQIGVRGLHFHRECVRDRHSCPGSKVSKPDMLARIGYMAAAFAGVPVLPLHPAEAASA